MWVVYQVIGGPVRRVRNAHGAGRTGQVPQRGDRSAARAELPAAPERKLRHVRAGALTLGSPRAVSGAAPRAPRPRGSWSARGHGDSRKPTRPSLPIPLRAHLLLHARLMLRRPGPTAMGGPRRPWPTVRWFTRSP
jgi:hypothetical protein